MLPGPIWERALPGSSLRKTPPRKAGTKNSRFPGWDLQQGHLTPSNERTESPMSCHLAPSPLAAPAAGDRPQRSHLPLC